VAVAVGWVLVGCGIGVSLGSGIGVSLGCGIGVSLGSGIGVSLGSGIGVSLGCGIGVSLGSGPGVSVAGGIGVSLGKGGGCARLVPVDAGKKAIPTARNKITIPAMILTACPSIRMANVSDRPSYLPFIVPENRQISKP